jgi:hypothetical protein
VPEFLDGSEFLPLFESIAIIFSPKIPEINLRRFSFQFSFEFIVGIHEKEKFQNI